MKRLTGKKVAVILCILLLLSAYLINDGFYVLSKIGKTEMDLLNEYATYPIENLGEGKFPSETIIESFQMEDYDESWFFSHTQSIDAILLVPTDAIDELCPEGLRIYDHFFDLSDGKEKAQFGVTMVCTVTKWWFNIAGRFVYYTVMEPEPEAEYTRIYVYVNYLGWNVMP